MTDTITCSESVKAGDFLVHNGYPVIATSDAQSVGGGEWMAEVRPLVSLDEFKRALVYHKFGDAWESQLAIEQRLFAAWWKLKHATSSAAAAKKSQPQPKPLRGAFAQPQEVVAE